MTLSSLLMVAASLASSASANAPIQALLSEQAQGRYERLRADPERSKEEIAELAKTTREFSTWQNRVEADKEKARNSYAALPKEEAADLFKGFRGVIREDSTDQLKSELEPAQGGAVQKKLADFWKCYWDPDSCKKRG